jgi:hypothetical protein
LRHAGPTASPARAACCMTSSSRAASKACEAGRMSPSATRTVDRRYIQGWSALLRARAIAARGLVGLHRSRGRCARCSGSELPHPARHSSRTSRSQRARARHHAQLALDVRALAARRCLRARRRATRASSASSRAPLGCPLASWQPSSFLAGITVSGCSSFASSSVVASSGVTLASPTSCDPASRTTATGA